MIYIEKGNEKSGIKINFNRNIFMPLHIEKGTTNNKFDSDNKETKLNWWVKTSNKYKDVIPFLPTSETEFKSKEDAINYCINWRENWLTEEKNKNIL